MDSFREYKFNKMLTMSWTICRPFNKSTLPWSKCLMRRPLKRDSHSVRCQYKFPQKLVFIFHFTLFTPTFKKCFDLLCCDTIVKIILVSKISIKIIKEWNESCKYEICTTDTSLCQNWQYMCALGRCQMQTKHSRVTQMLRLLHQTVSNVKLLQCL